MAKYAVEIHATLFEILQAFRNLWLNEVSVPASGAEDEAVCRDATAVHARDQCHIYRVASFEMCQSKNVSLLHN